ncbi:MAG: hypothetical protein EHM35_00440 [Planctomycetaceae bacterium]|nr:MAG: hypothetical protein EHM35_00440 [Planctomycetaceae bacterium]
MALFKRNTRRVVLALSDTHGGSRIGLLNPATVLERADDLGRVERWTPALGATQRWLWECYQAILSDAADLAGDDEIVAVHDGDITNGDRFGGNVPDTTLEDQRVIAEHNMLPVLALPQVKRARLVTGTAVHVPNCAEARVAARLVLHTGKEVAALHHGRANVDGVVFDLAHHGPHPGSRDWLRGNVALYYLKSAVYEDRRIGKEPARVYVRGHFHEYVPARYEEYWNDARGLYDLTVIPSFCGLNDHGRKATRSAPVLTVGMVAYVIEAGRLARIEPFTRRLDLRIEETL